MVTIVEAIKQVLQDCREGLTSAEIYEKIMEANLYKFKAQNPQAIVNGMVRRHCFGLDFPTASPHKFFQIVKDQRGRGKSRYKLYDQNQNGENSVIQRPIISSAKEKLPEEKMRDVYKEHITILKTQLMNAILNASPAFFESLVVELLMKMGYGYDDSSGKVTRYCRDGGVDGIIEEDKLGLDKIYIQAKRNAIDNRIGSTVVEQFLGVMSKYGVVKGVFITTSDFVKSVKEDYEKPIDGKMIRLINGDELMDYLIKYEIGVNNVMTYKTFNLDENYFDTQ